MVKNCMFLAVLLIIGGVAGDRFVAPARAVDCDNKCRERFVFYDCATGFVIAYQDKDCQYCKSGSCYPNGTDTAGQLDWFCDPHPARFKRKVAYDTVPDGYTNCNCPTSGVGVVEAVSFNSYTYTEINETRKICQSPEPQ
jgi:hypothetical protein